MCYSYLIISIYFPHFHAFVAFASISGILIKDTWSEGPPQFGDSWEYRLVYWSMFTISCFGFLVFFRPWTNEAVAQIENEFIHGLFEKDSLARYIKFVHQPAKLRVSFRLYVKEAWIPRGSVQLVFGDRVCQESETR